VTVERLDPGHLFGVTALFGAHRRHDRQAETDVEVWASGDTSWTSCAAAKLCSGGDSTGRARCVPKQRIADSVPAALWGALARVLYELAGEASESQPGGGLAPARGAAPYRPGQANRRQPETVTCMLAPQGGRYISRFVDRSWCPSSDDRRPTWAPCHPEESMGLRSIAAMKIESAHAQSFRRRRGTNRSSPGSNVGRRRRTCSWRDPFAALRMTMFTVVCWRWARLSNQLVHERDILDRTHHPRTNAWPTVPRSRSLDLRLPAARPTPGRRRHPRRLGAPVRPPAHRPPVPR
jgi:hypothetical protein